MRGVLRTGRVFTIMLFLLMVGGINGVSAESATPVAPDGDLSVSATNILSISTLDGGDIPAGTQISIMGGSGFPAGPAYSETLAVAQSSPYVVSGFVTTPGLVYMASTSGAAGYNDASTAVFGDSEPTTLTLTPTFVPGVLTVSTSDGGVIPAGTVISIFGGPTFPIGPAYNETLAVDQASPYTVSGFVPTQGLVYNASVSGAAGYLDGNSGNFNADTSANVLLTKQFIPGVLTISTSDGGNIPAGTEIYIMGGPSSPSGVVFTDTLASDAASPYTVSGFTPVAGNVYQVYVYSAFGYRDATSSQFAADVSTNVELQKQGSLTVSTSDGGDIPAGTRITVMGGVTYPAGPAYSEILTVDTPSPYLVTGFIPSPGYVYLYDAWDAPGYNDATSGTVAADASVELVLQLTTYTVTLNVTTSDGGVIPAGTNYTFTDSLNNTVLSGTLTADETSPWTATITDVPAGEYTLEVTGAAGYQDFSLTDTVSDTTTTFDVELQVVPPTTGTVNLTVTTDDGGNIPAGTEITVGGISYTATGSEASGSVIPFAGVPAGIQAIAATNAAPYNDATGAVDVIAGDSVDASIVLSQDPVTTGSISLTVTTSDGGAIPTGATFTLGGVTFTATGSDFSTADLASGSVIVFDNVPQGTQVLTVTNAAPYEDFTGSVTVVAGQTTDAGITLILAQEPATPTPTEPSAPSPTPTEPSEPGVPSPTATIPSFNPQNPVLPGKTPVPGDGTQGDAPAGNNGSVNGGGSGVTALPSTGQNPAGSNDATWLLLGLVALLAIGTLGAARRMQQR